IPNAGSSASAAIAGPVIAPIVFASVSHAEARVGDAIARLNSAANSVKSIPERNAVGPASAAASHSMRPHSAISAPAVVHWKPPYDATVAQPARNAIVAGRAARSPLRSSHRDPTTPPRPTPARTPPSPLPT